MKLLFVHQNFPAQFGHIARHLIRTRGWECSFVTQASAGDAGGIERIPYGIKGGARESNHYCSRTFENAIWHSDGVYQACKSRPDLKPDLIVGHSGFGSTLFLKELYPDVPIINYFEYFYQAHGSDMDFRPEFPSREIDFLRARARNAMVLLDLANCVRGYSPTRFQQSLFPAEFRSKIDIIFDGVDTMTYHRRPNAPRQVGPVRIPNGTRVVTYVSRGFESMRGFDIFMRAARRIYQEYPNVLFLVVGSDRVCYGGDERHIQRKTFREHVLSQEDYDLSKFVFTGLVPPATLASILSVSDLHIYLTVPFVLSWSLMNALACGCVTLASATAPVMEMIKDGDNGLLADFFDADGLASRAVDVLRDPTAYRPLGEAGERMIRDQYSLEQVMPRLVSLFEDAVAQNPT